jgi:hypothetical protein
MYPIGLYANSNGKLVYAWNYWDAENHAILENQTWEPLLKEPNPLGTLNAIFTHRMKPSRSHWTRDAQDLIDANRDIDIAMTSMNNAVRYLGFPILAALGMSPKEVGNIKLRFDQVLIVEPGVDPSAKYDLKFLYPSVDWDKLIMAVKSKIGIVAEMWNVVVRFEIAGTIGSGIMLKILSVDNRTDIGSMMELYEEYFEVPLFEKLKTMSGRVSWLNGISGTKLSLDWPEEPFIQTPAEEAQATQAKIQSNLTNPIDEIMSENPDLDEAAAIKQYVRNVKINSIVAKTPPEGLTEESILSILASNEQEAALASALRRGQATPPASPGTPTGIPGQG